MAFLGKFGEIFSKPFRGIGRAVRGDLRGAASDFGDTLKTASLPLSFINPALGAGARALGELGDRADAKGGIGGIKFGKDLLLPAATTYGAGRLGQGIGRALQGGAAAAAPGASQAASLASEGAPMSMGLIEPAASTGAALTQAAPAAGRFAGIGRALSGAGRFAAKNPELIGSALETYGDIRNEGYQRQLYEEELARRRRAAEAQAMALQSFYPSGGGGGY